MPRSPYYIATNLAKNVAAPVLIPLRRDRGSLGMDGDDSAVVKTLNDFAPGLRALGGAVEGKRVLELGPGRTPQIAMAMALAGASSVAAVDTSVQVPDGWQARGKALAAALASPSAAPFRAAVDIEPADVERRAAAFAADAWPVEFDRYSGTSLSAASGSVDLVISKSVLEHVRPAAVDPLLRELRRVIRGGGGMVHMIDLRDHMHIVGDAVDGDWLDALAYREWLFRAMFSRRSTAINRRRAGGWRRAFAEHGFDRREWREFRYPLPAGFDRSRLIARWRDLPEEELRVGQLAVALVAPGPPT